jgi:hypothetical protein
VPFAGREADCAIRCDYQFQCVWEHCIGQETLEAGMPTLPERATSILSVVAANPALGAAAAPASAPPSFDWRVIVERQRPGAKSESQQRQAQRFQQVRADLLRWVQDRGIAPEHVEESAFYATVCTTAATRQERVLGLALIVLWIYLLDDFMDRRDAAMLAESAAEGALPAAFVRDLEAALAPLGKAARIATASVPLAPDPTVCGEPSADALRVAGALRDVLAALGTEWAHPACRRQRGFRRALVVRQLALCAAAMLREVAWNVALARHPASDASTLPEFGVYLRNGVVSIGMPAVAATAASFEARPRTAWKRASLAIAAGGAVVRLTNDLHTYFADVAEGKLTSVTLRLRALGFALAGYDPDGSPEVQAAQTSLSEDLAAAVAAFGAGQMGLVDGPLALCARHAVAFALAVYGDGSRHRRDGRAA